MTNAKIVQGFTAALITLLFVACGTSERTETGDVLRSASVGAQTTLPLVPTTQPPSSTTQPEQPSTSTTEPIAIPIETLSEASPEVALPAQDTPTPSDVENTTPTTTPPPTQTTVPATTTPTTTAPAGTESPETRPTTTEVPCGECITTSIVEPPLGGTDPDGEPTPIVITCSNGNWTEEYRGEGINNVWIFYDPNGIVLGGPRPFSPDGTNPGMIPWCSE